MDWLYVPYVINCIFNIFFFFFQAEAGIRDLVRSRGLGDVYKRQRGDSGQMLTPAQTREFVEILGAEARRRHRGKTTISAHRALQFVATGAQPYRCAAGGALITVLPLSLIHI